MALPTFNVTLEDGEVCKVRRLGVGDYYKLLGFAQIAVEKAKDRNEALGYFVSISTVEGVISLLFEGVMATQGAVLEWLETLPVDFPRELTGAEWITVIEAVAKGKDVERFLSLRRILWEIPAVQNMIQKWEEAKPKTT